MIRTNSATVVEDPRLRNVANRRIASSVFLQQVLFYSFWFDWSWIFFWMVWLFYTYWQGLYFKDDDVVRIITMTFWLLAEPIRIASGYYGNLQENLPWLLLYTILCLVPYMPVCFYIMLLSFDIKPYNKAVQVPQVALGFLGFIAGCIAIRRMYRIQKEQYYQFEYQMNQRMRARREAEAVAAGLIGQSTRRL